jgi:hypothetical protein
MPGQDENGSAGTEKGTINGMDASRQTITAQKRSHVNGAYSSIKHASTGVVLVSGQCTIIP